MFLNDEEDPFLPLHLPVEKRYDIRALAYANDAELTDDGPLLFGYLPQKTKSNLEDSARWRAENQARREECERGKIAYALDHNRY